MSSKRVTILHIILMRHSQVFEYKYNNKFKGFFEGQFSKRILSFIFFQKVRLFHRSFVYILNLRINGGEVLNKAYLSYKEKLLTELYEEYSDEIVKYLAILLKDLHKAEDLVHETFTKAYEHLDNLQNLSNPKAWLYSIARNLSIDYLRRQNRYKMLLQILSFEDQVIPTHPENILIIKESSEELYRALFNLKDKYREVILLRKMKSFTIAETCEILGWSESKVKNTLSRALKALEKEINKGGQLSETCSI
jgi:RNA polymerase sigma-70 factor, ECF subfamily